MNVNIEFINEDAIDNLITNMNFRIDKTIFFGYSATVKQMKPRMTAFLKEYCDDPVVQFVAIPEEYKYDLPTIIEKIRKIVKDEIAQDNNVFFDVAGGESLILVAFGILANELNAPIHLIEPSQKVMIEYNKDADKALNKLAPMRKVALDVDRIVKMQGGAIKYQADKHKIDENDPTIQKVSEQIFEIMIRQGSKWNSFSALMREIFNDDDIKAQCSVSEVLNCVTKKKTGIHTIIEFDQFLDKMVQAGALLDFVKDKKNYRFRFANSGVKELIWDSGSSLELKVYYLLKDKNDDCRVGIHLDWDGTFANPPKQDVTNEVDVLAIKDYVPTFISCKSGKLDANTVLHALYELETVVKRFGIRNARKVLVTIGEPGEVHVDRAKEMGIELVNACVPGALEKLS